MRGLVVLAAVALAAAACGSSTAGSSPSPSPSQVVTTPAPTPAGMVFKLNGISTTATGTIKVSTLSGSMTVELNITGLPPASSHISHIHVGSCQSRGGVKFALNQVVADGQGDADTRTTVTASFPPSGEHWYVVVHVGPDLSTTASANYLLCGNLFK